MAAKSYALAIYCCIPELDCIVPACGYEVLAIRAEYKPLDLITVTTEAHDFRTGCRIP